MRKKRKEMIEKDRSEQIRTENTKLKRTVGKNKKKIKEVEEIVMIKYKKFD